MTRHHGSPHGAVVKYLGGLLAGALALLGVLFAQPFAGQAGGLALQPGDTAYVDLGPNDSLICDDDTIVLRAFDLRNGEVRSFDGSDTLAVLYLWSDGSTADTLAVDSANCYSVTVSRVFPDGPDAGTDPDTVTNSDRIFVNVCGDARKEAARWHFGTNAGLDFAGGAPAPNTEALLLDAAEGVAVISDYIGKFLFYSDGDQVFTREHLQMEGGNGLGGDDGATQATLIVPQPADCKSCPTRYYVFSVDSVDQNGGTGGQVQFAVVDMRLGPAGTDGEPLGEVVTKNQLLVGAATERIAAVENPQDSTFWIIVHAYGSATFNVFHLTEEGLDLTPQSFTAGTAHSDPLQAEGYMKASVDGTRLAVALSDTNNRFVGVEVFKLSDTTGAIQTAPDSVLRINVRPDSVGPPLAYGVEFANGGNYLYVSLRGDDSSFVYRYDISSFDSLTVAASRELVHATDRRLGALQVGPDSRIYVAVEGATALDVIAQPGASIGGDPDYQVGGQDLSGASSGLGLPNFVNTFVEPPAGAGFGFAGNCTDEPVNFNAGQICPPKEDTYAWTFPSGSPATSTEQNPAVVWSAPGAYAVRLIITNECKSDTIEQTVTITQTPRVPQIDTTGNQPCDAVWTIRNTVNDPSNPTYSWQAAPGASVTVLDQGRRVTIDRTRLTVPVRLRVRASNGSCFEESNQVTIRPFVRFQATVRDTILCGNTPVVVTPTLQGGTAATFRWSLAGSLVGSGNALTVTAPGTYQLIAGRQGDGCTDTTQFTVGQVQPPTIDSTVTPDAGCPGELGTLPSGRIQLLFSPSLPGYTYSWRDAANAPLNPQPADPLDVGGLVGNRNYRLVVSYAAACEVSYRFFVPYEVTQPRYTSPDVTADCETNTARVTLTQVTGPANLPAKTINYYLVGSAQAIGSYQLQDFDDATRIEIPYDFPPGNYRFEILSAPGPKGNVCSDAFNVRVRENPNRPDVALTFRQQDCNQGVLSAGPSNVGGTSYVWRRLTTGGVPQGPILGTAAQLTVTQSGSYQVVASTTPGCTVTRALAVELPPVPVVTVAQSQTVACEGETVQLSAEVTNAPPGVDLTYAWRRVGDNTNEVLGTGVAFGVTRPGTARYQVTVVAGVCTVAAQTTTNIVINPLPNAALGPDTSVCAGGSVRLAVAGGNGLAYEWREGGTLLTETGAAITVSPATTRTYRVRVRNGATQCEASDEVVVTVLPQPTVVLAGAPVISPCANDLVTLQASATGNVTYRWLRNGQPVANADGPTFTPRQAGVYEVVVQQGPCQARAQVQVAAIRPAPVVAPPPYDSLFCAGDDEELVLDAGPGNGLSYFWPHSGEVTRRVSVTQAGVYTVEITNVQGCTETLALNAVDFCQPRLFLADAFTPNQDGINDTWDVFGAYATDVELLVYNRWGEIIWQGSALGTGWDGTYRGADVPAGSYPWRLSFKGEYLSPGRVFNRSGAVLIIR